MTELKRVRLPMASGLGRHVIHDPRSRQFPVEAVELSTLRTVRHHSYIGILDQGDLGSCTGNAAVKCISHTQFWPVAQSVLTADLVADEAYAVSVYSDATKIDFEWGSYPPDDTGSGGLYVAKVLKRRGLISGYTHAFTMDAALTAISRQSVIVGIPWYEGMFYPDEYGFLTPNGNLAGGHEICVDEINVDERWVGFPNSWSRTWGVKGRGRISWDYFADLLKQDGDLTAFQKVQS